MGLLLLTVLAVVLWFVLPILYRLWVFTMKVRRSGQALDKFPGPPTHWLLGNMHQVPGINHAGLFWYLDSFKSYGPRAMRTWLGRFHVLLDVFHPETVKTVMLCTDSKPLSWGGIYRTHLPWLGGGLLQARGERWFRNRKLMTPAFHFGVLRSYVKIYNECADTFLDKMEAAVKEGHSVDISRDISLCTLDVILRCAFSYSADVQRHGEHNDYVTSLRSMAELMTKRASNPVLSWEATYKLTRDGRTFLRGVKTAHRVTEDVIASRKQALIQEDNDAEPKKKYLDFLDILLLAKDENGNGMTDCEIREEVDTFLFAGHDTTSSAISFALLNLARHPEHLKKCQEEIDNLLQDREEKDITWEDLSKIPYLTRCIKESMRLHSPVPLVGRETTQEFELDGVTIPPGTFIHIFFFLLHHNDEVWGPDHWDYIPDRFLPENAEKMHPFAFVPFSGGSRNCIGQTFAMNEIKAVVARIVQRFNLKADETHPVKLTPRLVLKSESGIWLYVERR